MQTFLFFWPLRAARPKLLFMLDEEEIVLKSKIGNSECQVSPPHSIPAECHSLDYKKFNKRLTDYRRKYNSTLQLLVDSNSERQFPSSSWIEGHSRSQLVGFYADQYVTSEFVAFVDADCLWTSYVDYQDLFGPRGRPIIMGKFDEGDMFTRSSAWILGGLPPPLSFMHYFPVIIRRSHVREIREYIERVHGKGLVEVFQQYRVQFGAPNIAHWDVMCTYLWHKHRSAYDWHADSNHGMDPVEMRARNLTRPMAIQARHAAIHSRYHHHTCSVPHLLWLGYCHSPNHGARLSHHKGVDKRNSLLQSASWHRRCSDMTAEEQRTMLYNFHSFQFHTDFGGNYTDLVARYERRRRRVQSCRHEWHFDALNATYLRDVLRDNCIRQEGRPDDGCAPLDDWT